MAPPEGLQLHASAVAVEGRAALITGAAGAGKSTLALEMLALGADLVADDRVDLARDGDAVRAACPEALQGLIEARGTGLLRVSFSAPAHVRLIVDLDRAGAERLPPLQNRDLLGRAVPVILGPARPGLAATVMLLLRGAALESPDDPVRG